MKNAITISCAALLFVGCGRPSTETTTTEATIAPVELPRIAEDWPGYYTADLPYAVGQPMEVSLWVRSDSTFILRQRYAKDSLAEGLIGQWHVVYFPGGPAGGLMTIGYAGDKPDFYRYTDKGLVMVDEMGVIAEKKSEWTLEKLADEIGDAIPRMRLRGTFNYVADAQSFKPCGSNFTWPCAGGMDIGEEEVEPIVKFTNADLQREYRNWVKTDGEPWVIEAVCTMGMGAAMEGDGADEYVYVEQVIRTLERCP